MRFRSTNRFEVLEDRRALAVTATVTAGGDLVVQGDADGDVRIVAVSAGAYQVTDGGVVVADASTLQGVTDDIRVYLTNSDEADSVTLDLGGQTVDEVYARLGAGDNSFQLLNGTADSFTYRGGSGADVVQVGGAIDGSTSIDLGSGDNSMTVTGTLDRLSIRGGSGADTAVISAEASIDDSVRLRLGGGDNSASIGGTIEGSLIYEGRDGDDAVSIADTASIADHVFARLGEGDNTVSHAGAIGGDLVVVSANENDAVDIADTASVTGETVLGLGEQREHGGRGRHGRGEFGGPRCEGDETAADDQTTLSTGAAAAQALLGEITGLHSAIARGMAGFFHRGFRR